MEDGRAVARVKWGSDLCRHTCAGAYTQSGSGELSFPALRSPGTEDDFIGDPCDNCTTRNV